MGLEEVSRLLDRLNVPKSAYSIGNDRDESYCVVQEGGSWRVYYSERGRRVAERTYVDENEAAIDLNARVLGDRIVRRAIDPNVTDLTEKGGA